jgi:hypothetical protein
MADVVSDYFISSDLIHEQVVPDRKLPESRFASRGAQIRRFGNQRCGLFDAGDKACRGRSVVFRNVCKNLIEIGESATFIPELYALR